MNRPDARRSTPALSACLALLATAAAVHADDATRVKDLVAALKGGPRAYYTTAALDYQARQRNTSPQGLNPEFIDRALRSLKAACDLGDMGSRANGAVESLVEMFPTAVHVVTVQEVFSAGQGSFEDWIMTRVMGEKSKFLIAPPFLGYDQMSACEQFLDATQQVARMGEQYGPRGQLLNASATITITFTFYAGACALSRITGQAFGLNENDWRNWWLQNRASLAPPGPAAPAQPAPGASLGRVRVSDLIIGGTYRFTLTTGDVFKAVVDSRSDTTLVVDAEGGRGLTFRTSIVRDCELLSLPARLAARPADGGAAPAQGEALSWDAVTASPPLGRILEVRINNGQSFQGDFAGVEGDNLKLSVQGSVIPFNKNVIVGIAVVPPQRPKTAPPVAASQPLTAPDTLIVRNPKVDEWGRRGPSLMYAGTITRELADRVVMRRSDGTSMDVKLSEVERTIKHTTDTSAAPIQRYARPLLCPDDMVLVDLPPGKQARPFFKVCVDKYEGPNQLGGSPQGNISYADAQRICGGKGKRVCRAQEWQWTCSGLEGYAYPYGHSWDEQACNSAGYKMLSSSGARPRCVSKFGAYDMTGNLFEWVTTADGKPALMGGPNSKCASVSPGSDAAAQPYASFRCCKSN